MRALHRDAGYFVIGLTFVYAISGLAVNHIADWEPNFRQVTRQHQLPTPLPEPPAEVGQLLARRLNVKEPIREVFEASDERLEVVLDQRTFIVTRSTGEVTEEASEPRFFIRLANWLHLNRGKKAWTLVADGYAVILLFLATSGLFMFSGRRGIFGRAGLIAVLGALLPIGYVAWSGGP